MDKSNPVYMLRLKDIIPFAGMKNYNDRCRWEGISNSKPGGEDLDSYYRKCLVRKLTLGLYTSVLVAVPLGGALFGLVKLVLE